MTSGPIVARMAGFPRYAIYHTAAQGSDPARQSVANVFRDPLVLVPARETGIEERRDGPLPNLARYPVKEIEEAIEQRQGVLREKEFFVTHHTPLAT